MGEPERYRLRSAILLTALIGLPAWAIVGNPWDSRLGSSGDGPRPAPSGADQEPAGTVTAPFEPAALTPPTESDVAQAAFAEEPTPGPIAAEAPIAPSAADEYAQRAASGAHRWQEIQHRLRELGATYYLLETWGPSGEQFRFHCQVAVAGNSSYARSFEAVASNAVDAMEEVLQHVEHWRAGDAR